LNPLQAGAENDGVSFARFYVARGKPHDLTSAGRVRKPGEVTAPVANSTKISPENKRKVLGENALHLLGLGL
jgi:hypothetical protein